MDLIYTWQRQREPLENSYEKVHRNFVFCVIEMGKSVPKNFGCPCGSGKKYKDCCFADDWKRKQAQRKTITLNLNEGSQVKRNVHSLDSIPTHNTKGLTPDITKKQMIALVLDEFFRILSTQQVETLVDMTNRVVEDMNIVPVFTYRDIGNALDADSRFEHYCMQLVCLAGDDPVEVYVDKMGT